MADRTTPYLAFNFLVSLSPGSGSQISGGFSDVSGLSTEITEAEYRAGNSLENHADKFPGVYKTGDVTLKRGLINSTDIYDWLDAVRKTGLAAKKASVTITLLDEARKSVATWTLKGVNPKKHTGPTLAGKGGADVAMEELVLSVDTYDFAFN
jgi:phage tail-like protein